METWDTIRARNVRQYTDLIIGIIAMFFTGTWLSFTSGAGR
jgi:hypothetical protein